MNYESAISILGLPTVWTDDLLTKAYRKQAKRYHPDKNPSVEANLEFDLVKRAYDFLQENKTNPRLSTIFESEKGERQSSQSVWSMEDFESLTEKLRKIDSDKVSRLLNACKSVVSITRDLVGELSSKNSRTIERIVRTNLEQMLTDQMYIIKFGGETYMIPLWYPHVYFELDDGNVLSVTVDAELPPSPACVFIDDENNIVLRVTENSLPDIRKYMNKGFLESPLGARWASQYELPVYPKGSKLRIEGAGLLKIDDDQKKLNRTERAAVIVEYL
jgi:hypothetical protein